MKHLEESHKQVGLGIRQRVESSWLSFLVSDVQFCMVCMFTPPGPLETDPIESELSGFPGQV